MHTTQKAFEQVLQHGQTVKQHGQKFENLGKSLAERQSATAQVVLIKSLGQQIQQHGQIMTASAEQALQQEQYLTTEYVLVHQQHIQAILLYIQAIKVLVLLAMQPETQP